MKGTCLCGGVTIEVPGRPEYINVCNCKLCRSSGTACGYYPPGEVTITGELRMFERNDIGEVWLTSHFCPTCGATTHWSPTGRTPLTRMGVNMRLFAQDELDGVPVKYQDGRMVETEDDEFVTTATGHIGDGKAF